MYDPFIVMYTDLRLNQISIVYNQTDITQYVLLLQVNNKIG